MLETNHRITKAIQQKTGKNAGINIINQLNALQFSIGCASGWNARIAMIAIDKKVPGHDTHPNLISGIFFTLLSFIYSLYQNN